MASVMRPTAEHVDRQILEYLVNHKSLDFETFLSCLSLPIGEVERSIHRLTQNDPPIINRVGSSTCYQLSSEGRRLMKVAPPTPKLPDASSYSAPRPRGQIVAAMKEKPRSVVELMRVTGLRSHQVRWFLKTLDEKALINERRSPIDGRIILYGLKTVDYIETPAAPLVTPLIDPFDWRTWMQRLLIQKLGGAPVIWDPPLEADQAPDKAQPAKDLPRILVVGFSNSLIRQQLQRTFDKRLKLYFFDHRTRSQGLSDLCRRVDHIFLRSDHCSHAEQVAIRASAKPFNCVHGNALRVSQALERFCV